MQSCFLGPGREPAGDAEAECIRTCQAMQPASRTCVDLVPWEQRDRSEIARPRSESRRRGRRRRGTGGGTPLLGSQARERAAIRDPRYKVLRDLSSERLLVGIPETLAIGERDRLSIDFGHGNLLGARPFLLEVLEERDQQPLMNGEKLQRAVRRDALSPAARSCRVTERKHPGTPAIGHPRIRPSPGRLWQRMISHRHGVRLPRT